MPDIGATLREARMRAKIDINEVEVHTKIRAKYLRAIENEEWDLLPGDVYIRSFLRTYGDFLGLDSRALIDDFKRRYERLSDNEMRPITPRGRERERERRRRRLSVPPWAVIGLVLVAVVAALYFVGQKNKTTSTPTATVGAAKHHVHHPRSRGAGAGGTRVGASAGVASHRPHATSVRLELVATGQVYVCLVDGSGRKLIPGTIYNPGQRIPTETAPQLLLTLGNAAVRMKVNGAPVAVAPSRSSIGYRLTPRGHSVLSAAQQPSCA
jgi:cytoskeleton protein RodZ